MKAKESEKLGKNKGRCEYDVALFSYLGIYVFSEERNSNLSESIT